MATLPLPATLILLPIKLSGVPAVYAERDRVPILNKLIWAMGRLSDLTKHDETL